MTVTIVFTQRERFSLTQPSLESVYEHTHIPFQLVYVDGNSPPHIQAYLELEAKTKGFTLIRKEQFLSPNQARNLGCKQVNTKYVVFVDNDVLVTPGWLNHLVDCAEDTGAWIVAPLYLEGLPENQIIHMAGGIAQFRYKHGKKIFFEKLRFCKRKLTSLNVQLHREMTELVEFHCVLVRTEVLEHLGYLDEKLMSTAEHLDLSLLVREAGGIMYFEPKAVVSYVTPPPFESWDLPFFWQRWSHEWNQASLNHFREKWHLAEDDPFITGHYRWLAHHRQLAYESSLHKILHINHDSWMNRYIISPLESKLNII